MTRMRGVQWDPAGGFYCRDCGGYEVDLLEGGLARCRTCGRTSTPAVVSRGTGVARVMLWVSVLFAGIIVAEIAVSWAYAAISGAEFAHSFSILAFVTGFVALVVAGLGAAPGHVAFGNQRMDRLQFAGAIQDPVIMGTLATEAKPRPSGEPGAAGIFLTFGLGVALILAAAALTGL